MAYKFLDKKSKGSGVNIPLEFNEQLAEDLHKPIFRNFKKRTVYCGFRDNIWVLLLCKFATTTNNMTYTFIYFSTHST